MAERIEFEPEDEDIDFDADPALEEALEDAESSYRGRDDLRSRGKKAFSTVKERGRERLYEAADRGKSRVADVLEDAAANLDGRLFYSAEYLRTSDIGVIRDDIVAQVRRRPLLSAGIAVGAGYLIGKALSGSGGGKKKRTGSKFSSQVSRAVISSLGAVVAAKMRDGLMHPNEEEPEPPARSRKRSSAG